MKKLRQSEIWAILALAAFPFGLMGANCKEATPAPRAGIVCETNTAQIAIWDGFVQRVCGCGGTDNEIVKSPATLTCTAKLGTTVFVFYQGPAMRHQIVPVGSPGMPAGAVYDPGDDSTQVAHAFTPTATGVYQWKDQYDPGLSGNFTITP